MPLQNVIEFDAVGLRYGQGAEVLRDVSFALPAGSFHFQRGSASMRNFMPAAGNMSPRSLRRR